MVLQMLSGTINDIERTGSIANGSIGATMSTASETRASGQGSAKQCLTYTVPEAGALLGLTLNGSYAAAARGDFPVIRIGKLLRVPKEAFHRMREQPAAKAS
jgi:excisionase family DNA binding protein